MIIALLSDITQRPTTMDPTKAPAAASNTKAAQPAAIAAGASRDDADASSEGERSDVETPRPPNAPRDMPTGLILKSGRVRLPDKLMEYLNKEVSEALYWMPEGEAFAFHTEKAQEQFLDKFFSGTKLSSFLRSISRW